MNEHGNLENVAWRAQWIWVPGVSTLPNATILARRRFELANAPSQATIHVAAKDRYWLYVNGSFIAEGPPPCHPGWQYFDTHEITDKLQAGANVVGIYCHNNGIACHGKPGGPGGVIAQLEILDSTGERIVVTTDDDWRCLMPTWIRNNAPRIRYTLGFQQHVDMRAEPVGWEKDGFDDSSWPQTEVLGPAIHGQWCRLIPRDIPLLERIPTRAQTIVGCGSLRRPDGMTFANFDSVFSPNEAHSGYALTHIFSPRELDALIEIECDDAFKCWLNAVLIKERHRHRCGRGSPREKNLAKLNDGWNPLLLKIEQQPGAPVFWVRVTDKDGDPVPGICFAGHPEKPELGEWRLAGPFPAEEHDLMAPIEYKSPPSVPEPGSQWDVEHVSPDLSDAEKLKWRTVAGEPEFTDPAALATWDVHEDGLCTISGLRNVLTKRGQAVLDENNNDVFITLDFGRDHAGRVFLDIDAPEGTVVDLSYDETLDDNGHVNCERMDDMRYADRIITRKGRQSWQGTEPRTFRYMQLAVRNITGPVKIKDVGIVETTCAMPTEADFATSDDLINRIFQVGLNTLRPNMQEEYHDGWRELAQYILDGWITARSAFYAHGELATGRKALYQFAQAQLDDGYIHDRWPTGAGGMLIDECIFLIPWLWDHYMFSGDRQILEELYPVICRLVQWLNRKTDDYGLICDPTEPGRVDVLIDHPRYTLDRGRGQSTSVNALYHGGLICAAMIADSLGKNHDASDYRRRAGAVKEALNQRLFLPDEGIYANTRINDQIDPGRSVHANVLPIAFDIADGRITPQTLIRLFGMPGVAQPATGYFHHHTLTALLKLGLERQFITLIRSYWGDQINRGATSWWEESYPSQLLDSGVVRRHPRPVPVPRSHSHSWCGSPTYYLPREILGVKPTKPGLAEFVVAPRRFDLTSASGSVHTPRGRIHVSWRLDVPKSVFVLEVTVPDQTRAKIELPRIPFPVSETICDGKTITDGKARQLDSGRHLIQARW